MIGCKPVVEPLIAMLGGKAELISHSSKPWASITFSGSLHRVVLKIDGDDALTREAEFTDALPEHEFNIPGQLVGDAGVVATENDFIGDTIAVTMTVELLLLERED